MKRVFFAVFLALSVAAFGVSYSACGGGGTTTETTPDSGGGE